MRQILRLILLCTLALSAFTAEPPKPASKDQAIEQNIKARYAKSKIASDKFTVKVEKGVATIEGRTDIIQHKGAATRMAKTGGATQVVNKIQISENAKQKASNNLEKGRKRAEVKPM